MGLGKPSSTSFTLKQLTNPVVYGGVVLVDGGTDMSARWTDNGFDNVHEAMVTAFASFSQEGAE